MLAFPAGVEAEAEALPRDHGAPRHCRPACHHRFRRRPGTPGLGITQDGHTAGAGTRQHVAGAVRPVPPRSS